MAAWSRACASRACATPATRPSGRGSTRTRARDEIVILDVSATPEGRGHQHETIRRVREVLSIPLTVGGGVRDGRGRLASARGRRRQGLGQHRGGRAAGDPDRHRRAVRAAVLRGRDRRRLARRARSRCWSRAGARAPGIDAIELGARGRAARGGRGAADLLGPRRHPLGLRSGADRRGGARRCACR